MDFRADREDSSGPGLPLFSGRAEEVAGAAVEEEAERAEEEAVKAGDGRSRSETE